MSTIESDYIATNKNTSILDSFLWPDIAIIWQNLNLHSDNQSAIELIFHGSTKHVKLCHWFIQDYIEEIRSLCWNRIEQQHGWTCKGPLYYLFLPFLHVHMDFEVLDGVGLQASQYLRLCARELKYIVA